MASPDVAEGKKFSLLYTNRSSPSSDSDRARRRIAAQLTHYSAESKSKLLHLLRKEVGADISHSFEISSFIQHSEIIDLLDSITIIYKFVSEEAKAALNRIFEEENLTYRIDSHGGVHYRIDEEHAANVMSAISALDAPRYRAVLSAFKHAQDSLDQVPPDLKTAMRSTFEAVEILFKLMVTKGVQRIGSDELRQHLTPLLERAYA